MSSEYPDAFRATVQDFKGGRRSGQIAFELDGSTLHLAITVQGDPNITCGGEIPVTAHSLELLLDSSRGSTVCPSRPGSEDRRLVLRFDPLTTSVVQYMGNGSGWSEVSSSQRWPVEHQTVYQSTEARYVIELAIRLKRPGLHGPAPIIRQGQFGLGMNFQLPCDKGLYTFPNRGPTHVVDPFRPATWETVKIAYPPSVGERVLSYNVGQMPFGLSDGGSGDPEHFGYVASIADHSCLSEVWPHDAREDIYWWGQLYASLAGHDMWAKGRPRDLDTLEEEFPSQEGSPVVQVASMPPTWVIIGDPVIAGLAGLDDEDTGLLVLSRRPFLNGKVVEYGYGNCLAEDCFEDKGFIWARVLTNAAEPSLQPPVGEIMPNQSYNGDEFIDLFCTHLQANPELPTFGVPASTRAAQISELMTFANQVRAPDRPALLMGDLNINGKEWPHEEYASLLANLGISQLTAFDQNNSFLSKRYDLGVHDSYTTVASDLSAAQQGYGSIGEGTWLDQLDCEIQFTTYYGRLDYIFALPAPGVLPAYGIGAKDTSARPRATPFNFLPGSKLNPGDPVSPTVPGTTECLSDHAALFGALSLVRLAQPGTWNPASWHKLVYRVGDVEDLTDDCWGCGDADFWGEVRYGMSPNSSGAIFFRQTHVIDDDPNPNLGLEAALFSEPIYPPGTASDLDRNFWTRFTLMEDDTSSPDDHYDVSPFSGQHDALFRFYTATGQWVLVGPHGTTQSAGHMRFTSALTWPTLGKEGSDYARAVHHLKTVEVQGPQVVLP